MDQAKLREKITERFNEGELRTLCFDLKIDYDDLEGEGRPNKVRELIAYLERRGRIAELLEEVRRARPDIPWEEISLPPAGVSSCPTATKVSRKRGCEAKVIVLLLVLLVSSVGLGVLWQVLVGRGPLYTFGILETATPVAVSVLTPKPTSAGGTSTPSPMPTTTPLPTLTPTCPCQAATDEDTIRKLIQAEGEAVKKKDISIIKAIFAEHATIQDGANPEQKWNDPVLRYETLFAETTFTEAIHFEAQPVGDGITVAIAWFTSGSKGEYVTWDGHSGSYDHPACSDHWTFEKNRSSCWVITRFTFNACHISFPP